MAPKRSQKITIIFFTFVTGVKHTSWCLLRPSYMSLLPRLGVVWAVIKKQCNYLMISQSNNLPLRLLQSNFFHCLVQSVECRVQCLEFRVQSVECRVQSVECRVYCRVQSVECRLQGVECRVQSEECTVYSVQCTVYSVQCAMCSIG